MNIYLDIETIPGDRPGLRDEIAASITPPGNISKAETIAAWERDKKPGLIEEAYSKTGLDGATGQIICIGFAKDSGTAEAIHGAEADVIAGFFGWLDAVFNPNDRPLWIGHNVAAFDMKYIWQRAIVNGIKPPRYLPRNPKPWDETVFDTMTQWAGPGNRISLDKLCKALGIDGKGEVSGKDVWPMYRAGKLAEIAEYCKSDVETTRKVYKRLVFA